VSDPSKHITADQLIVQRALKGDRFAFAGILEKTGNMVAHIICRMGIPAAERNDLSQDIYLKVYRQLAGFRFQSKLSTWIARIAYNACTDYLAKKKLEILPLNESIDEYVSDQLADHPLQQKQDAALLSKAMESLSPLYRTLIALYHQEEFSYEEINQVTGLPLGTVKNYLFRARKLLKDKL
jgi:RNA polymerase sigma factor (sigma-70 family)